MKILIAYDGSECSESALRDLKNAGFRDETEALLLTVTDDWSLMFAESDSAIGAEELSGYPTPDAISRIRERSKIAFAQSEKLVKSVAEQLQKEFPAWKVRGEAEPGFDHWSILERADKWKPDLIVVGSHGRNILGRIVLGSSSLKILTEAKCSVRIGRASPGRTADDDSPQRIVIGFDGSRDAQLAVDEVARRTWRGECSVRLVTAIDLASATSPSFEKDLIEIEEAKGKAVKQLEAIGLHVSTHVRTGDPKTILIEEAESWAADAIFIGARGHGLIERILLGSVSYSVAARAECSVEVVR